MINLANLESSLEMQSKEYAVIPPRKIKKRRTAKWRTQGGGGSMRVGGMPQKYFSTLTKEFLWLID